MYSYNLNESEGEDDLDDIRYAGYAWDEVMMPKQTKKNKSIETTNISYSSSQNESDTALLVKSQTSSFHSHLFDSSSTLPKPYLTPFMGPSICRPQFKEISFDWRDPSPHISPKKNILQSSPIKEVPMIRNPIPEPKQEMPIDTSIHLEKTHDHSFPQFPTLISSQVLPSQRSHIPSSQSSIPRITEPIRDWSTRNKSWINKRHTKSSLPKLSSTKPPSTLSLPLSQMIQSQVTSSLKRPLLSSSSPSTPVNWRLKLDNEARNLPDFPSYIQGKYSQRLKDCVIKRDSFFQVPSRIPISIQAHSFHGYNEYDYASVLGVSTVESIHRIVTLFHNGPYEGMICLFLVSIYIMKCKIVKNMILCVKQGYSILQQELSLPILLDVSGIAIEEDQLICTFLNNHLPQENILLQKLEQQLH